MPLLRAFRFVWPVRPVRSFALLAVSTALLLACSSTSTGTGGSSGNGGGNKGGGLLGGIDKGGTGGSSGGTVTSCAAASGDTACGSCLKSSCCAQLTGCNSECATILDCAGACSDDACTQACYDAHPQGQAGVQTLVTCASNSCESSCSESTTEEDAGTGTTPNGCLGAPVKDSDYCPNAAKPYLLDCPNGSPGAQCSLSPTGAANVYCCP